MASVHRASLRAPADLAFVLVLRRSAGLSLEEIDALFADGKVHLRRSPREPVQGFIEGVSNGVKVQGETQHVEKASVSV